MTTDTSRSRGHACRRPPPGGWIADVVVHPEHRRQGLGTLLVDGLMADLEALGLRRVLLKASPEGHDLYRKAGFDGLDEPDAWLLRRLS